VIALLTYDYLVDTIPFSGRRTGKQMCGFLTGIDTTVDREADRR
jgi:hypothetical protein